MADRSCGRSVRTGTLACFVRVDAAFDTPGDSQTDDGAESGVNTEGALDDEDEYVVQQINVHEHDHQREDHIGLGHERDDERREGCDSL